MGTNWILLSLDETIYPLDAIYGAAYLFVDRCYVFLSRDRKGGLQVRLTSKEEPAREDLEVLAGELGNELLNQALRLRLAESTARIREYYSAAALRASSAGPSIDDLLSQLEAEELSEDPLEILVPWEKKYGVPGGDTAAGAQDRDGHDG